MGVDSAITVRCIIRFVDKLKAYLKSRRDGAAFAVSCGTTIGHLRNAVYGFRQLAPEVCVAIERESGKAITRRDLRPDWHRIWPELVNSRHPAPADREAA